MTILRRLGIGYAWISGICLLLVAWLGYHEFVAEPAEFAAMGLTNVHKDTEAELLTVCFLAIVPLLLGAGWWWIRRVLAPLGTLAEVVEKIDSNNLRQPLVRSGNGDEVDKLTAGFNGMIARIDESIRHIHEFTLHSSHELKTPLTVMRAQLETVLREIPSPVPDQWKWIDSQIDEVKRLTKIVDSLTLLTKADSGLVELERLPVRFDELVEESFEDAQILARPQGLTVTLDACDETTVSGDRHRLRQLLLILTDNAVKYSEAGGRIAISLRRKDDAAELRTTNTGGGMAPKTLENIFGRFVRGENAQGRVEGCGLGLAIAQWIVLAHGGSIRLVADPGGMTTAMVRLPLGAGSPATTHSGRGGA